MPGRERSPRSGAAGNRAPSRGLSARRPRRRRAPSRGLSTSRRPDPHNRRRVEGSRLKALAADSSAAEELPPALDDWSASFPGTCDEPVAAPFGNTPPAPSTKELLAFLDTYEEQHGEAAFPDDPAPQVVPPAAPSDGAVRKRTAAPDDGAMQDVSLSTLSRGSV